MTTTLTQFEEEKLGEFDQNQRLFLAGRYHSTKFNDWFLDVLHQQREMMRKEVDTMSGINIENRDGTTTVFIDKKDIQTLLSNKEI